LSESVGAQAERREAELESACWMLLRRYGVVFRDVLERETTIPRWRELQGMFRRLEARGSVRGGRFLSGFGGEQFAVPEAVASLRETRLSILEEAITVAAADPLNLAGVVVPGERPAAVPGKTVTFLAGAVRMEEPSLAVPAI
jgi:ATP-dependent Lhr-like helicase